MKTALRLARRGTGSAEPNPLVGAVLVRDGEVIGRGWHKKFGEAHAEINALRDCKSRGGSPEGATLYVTLEPCCHRGKTGPCTDAIIKEAIKKVVVAMVDPSEHAARKCIEMLKKAGIEVQTGVGEKEARQLNAPFIKYNTTGKTWVIVKWAQTIDGKLAYIEGSKKRWISNERSRKDSHKLRRRVQGIMVGIGTILSDDPLLTPRPSRGRKPVRIILDSRLRIPPGCRVLKSLEKGPVLIVTTEDAKEARPELVEKIQGSGAELLTIPSKQGRFNLEALLAELARRGIAQLLVEGGGEVISSFLRENLADELCVYIAPKLLGISGSTDISKTLQEISEGITLENVNIKRFGGDIKVSGFVKRRDLNS